MCHFSTLFFTVFSFISYFFAILYFDIYMYNGLYTLFCVVYFDKKNNV